MKTIMITIALASIGLIGVNVQTQAANLQYPGINLISLQTIEMNFQSQEPVKTEISTSELLKPIQDNLASKYKGWTVEKAYKVDSKGIIQYKVLVKKDAVEKKVIYDKDGNFLSEAPMEKMSSGTKSDPNPPK